MSNRCTWAKSPEEIEYHDYEWGVPVHDDRKLFEFLVLDAFQAGLCGFSVALCVIAMSQSYREKDYN